MGSFINVGLVAKGTIIKKAIIDFLSDLSGFELKIIKYPFEYNYNEWISLNGDECSLPLAVEYICNYNMSYFIGKFRLNNRIVIDNVEFTIEKSVDNICFIVKIPDEKLLENIDDAEQSIIKLLNIVNGFDFAFCDAEAHLGDDNYSISVNYIGNAREFVFSKWKIDGFSER